MNEKLLPYIEKLGLVGTDRVTGFTGCVDSVAFDLYGCVQVAMRSRTLDKDGKMDVGVWLDHNRIAFSDERIMPVPAHFAGDATLAAMDAKGAAEKPTRRA